MRDLPEGWIETTLGEVVTFQRGFDLPKKDRADGCYPLMVSNGQDGEHKDYKVKAPGVVTGRSGTLGKVYYINKDFWPLNTTLWVKNFHGNNVKFIYYFLKVFPFENYNSGSGVPTLNRNHIHPVPVKLPPLPEQKAIADMLSSFDEKIELLREQNKTLETLAQTIFKEWFVHFNFPDPHGKPYRNNGGAMVESELGLIPKGWECKEVESVAARIAMGPFGSNIKVSTFVSEGVPVISGQHLHEVLLTDSESNHVTPEHAEKLKNSRVVHGDIIFTHAGNIGQVSMIPENAKYSEYIISQRQFFLRVDKEKASNWFLLMFFRSRMGQHLLLSNASQVGVPSIARPSSHLKSIKLPFPPRELQCEFEDVVASLMGKVHFNKSEITQLSKTRDTLLPKLMSGQVRIRLPRS